MKKNVIAVLLSIAMTIGSVGAVPVFAAETNGQDAVIGLEDDSVLEDVPKPEEETAASESVETPSEGEIAQSA